MELVKILYNVETYRASMMEFEINLSELPLGNLSKSNIPKGLEPFNTVAYAPIVKGRPIVDASNIVFIVIPSIHPLVIKDEDDFKSKRRLLKRL
ncbi:hypothetical protein Pfo_020453 [Paulownia fortunei]|nr:hypothetical protein Pfo_020453 [Paulownia fortunei]